MATGLWPEEGKIFGTFAYIKSLKSSTSNAPCLTSEEDSEQGTSKDLLTVGGLCIGGDPIYSRNDGLLAGRELFGIAR